MNSGVEPKEYEKSDAKTYKGEYKILFKKNLTRRPQRSFTFRTCLIYCRMVPHAFWAQLSILLQHKLPPSFSFGIALLKIYRINTGYQEAFSIFLKAISFLLIWIDEA